MWVDYFGWLSDWTMEVIHGNAELVGDCTERAAAECEGCRAGDGLLMYRSMLWAFGVAGVSAGGRSVMSPASNKIAARSARLGQRCVLLGFFPQVERRFFNPAWIGRVRRGLG
jgi:hypothetical protein